LPDFLIFAAALAKWMGAKLILDMHEITPEFYISKYGVAQNSWGIRLLKRMEKWSMDFADQVITINEPIQTLLGGRGLATAKATVIMNAADEARFAANSSPSAALTHRGQEQFVMMYHGTLTRIYGLDLAIEALARVRHELPQAELWILGTGPEKSALAALAKERGLASRVKLFGQVAPAEIPNWLSRCDVGLLPIRRDVFLDFAFPNKLPEFIIAGKTVLVSRLNAIRHYFSEDALWYFEPNNVADLSDQMLRIYRDHQMQLRRALTAKTEYLPIRWSVMRDRYLQVVDCLAKQTNGQRQLRFSQGRSE
jgi:glycosyltransferase involved in cell wall biosynthesis